MVEETGLYPVAVRVQPPPSGRSTAAYQRRRYAERMAWAKEYLGGRCVRCGSEESLEFDHVDPTTKRYTISTICNLSLDRMKDELAKCQLLCADCHDAKSNNEDPRNVPHGGGSQGRRGCKCEPCRSKRSEYNRTHRKP